MAKYFIINLSPEDKTINFQTVSPEGEQLSEKKKLREIELIVMQNMFRYARKMAKDFDLAMTISDCIDQVKNITDAETFIRFTKEDIGFLKDGFKVASGGPEINVWLDSCYDLMKQLKDPKPEEVSGE